MVGEAVASYWLVFMFETSHDNGEVRNTRHQGNIIIRGLNIVGGGGGGGGGLRGYWCYLSIIMMNSSNSYSSNDNTFYQCYLGLHLQG